MFYSQFILAKKGPLGTIWIAAHLERKLKKNQVADTDIGISVDSILSPEVPIALRLSSHLLLGVVKIYSRKVNYLFNDCSETLVKIKQAFHSSAVDLPPEQSTAPYHSITLPETFDFEDLEFPDSSFSYGNFVDHHVTTREQITLQDTLDDPVYLGSQFGLDERFGDGEASQAGFEFDEDLFADEDDRQEPNSAGGCIDRNVSAAAVDDVTDKNRTESMKNQTHIHTDANNEMNIHVDTEPSSGYSLQQQESNSQHIVPSVTEALENCYKEMRTPDLTEGAFSLATNKLVEQEKFMDGMPVCDAVDVPNAVPSAQHHLSFENVQSVNLVDASNFIKQTSMEMSVATTSWPSSAFVVPSSTTSTSPTKVAELTTLNASNQVSNDVLVSQSGSSLVCKDWTEVLKLGNTVDVQVGQHAPFHSQPNLTSQLNLDNIKHGLQSFPSNVSSHLIPGTHSEILSNVTGHDCALTKMPGVETGISQAPYTAFHERNQIVVSERDLFSGAENQQFTRATELHEVMHKLSTGDNSKVEDAQMNVNSGCGNQDYAQTTEFHDPMSNTVYRQDPGVFQQQNHNAKVYEQLCLLAASQNNSMIEDTQKLMVNTCAKEMHPQMKRLHESMLGTYPQEMHLCTTEQLNNIPHMQQNMDLMLSSKDYSQVEIQEPMTDISGEDHIATLQRHMTSSCVQPPVNVSGVENNRFSTSSCSADANAVTTSLACSGSSAVSPVDRMQGVSQVNFKDQISLPSSVSPMPALANVSSTGDATENPPSNFPSHSETQRNYYSEQTGSILQPCSSLQDPGKHTSVASGILPSQSDLHRKVIQSESCFKNISLVSTSTTSTSMSQPQISAMDGNPNALLVSELSNPAVSIPEYVASESQKENRTSSSEIPACETLRASANTVVMEAVDKDLNQTLSLEDRCTEGGKAASASPSDGTRKRNIVEITPVLREGLPSRRRPSISNKTMDYIPADDDVLASILGRTPTFKVKETPVETTSVKRRRLTPKATPLKRKALVDVAIVLHSDQIRQQLENTEDIRRARKKALCTRTEIWTGDRESKGQQIFFEPLIPDMCSELLDLYDNVREIKLKQHWDIVTNGKSEGSQIENDFGSNRGAQLVESHGNINEKRHESGSYSLDDDHQLEVVSQLHQSTVHTNTADKVLGDDVYRMNSIVESERAASHLDSREGKQRGRWLETFEPGIHMEIFDPEQRKGEQHLHKPTAQEPQRVCADNDQSKVEETHSQFVTALNQRKGAEVHSYSEYTTEHVGPKMAHHDGDKNAETVSRETRISNDNSIVLNKAEEDRSSSRLHHIESSREHTCITRGEEDQRDSIQLHQAEAFTLHTDDAVSLKTSLTESGLQHHHLLEGRCNSGSLADSLENRGLLVPAESNKKSLEEYSASSTITEKENEPNPLLESQEAVRTEHPYALGKKSPVSNNDILSSQRSDMNVDVGNIYVLPTERIPYNERIMGEEPINVRNEGRQYVAPRESTESDVSEAWLDKGVVGLEPTINQSLKKLTKQEERKTKSFINNNEAQDAGMLYGARSTDFLVRDDDPHSELEDNGGEHSCRDSIQENNGWSARTRAVGKYLKSVYEHMDCNAYANSQKKLCLSDLLAGKTRKEAARMFFETLVLKTRDYVHVEQKASFGEISIFPKVNLMKSSL